MRPEFYEKSLFLKNIQDEGYNGGNKSLENDKIYSYNKKVIWQNWCFGQLHHSKIEKQTGLFQFSLVFF